MATGRCSGCGRIDSLRKTSQHIVDCNAYLDLYRCNSTLALDPAAEYARYRAEDRNPQARARQRGERLAVRFAELNRQQVASASRWARPPDILD